MATDIWGGDQPDDPQTPPADQAPSAPDWLHDPNHEPSFDPPAGQKWFWTGSQWSTKPIAATGGIGDHGPPPDDDPHWFWDGTKWIKTVNDSDYAPHPHSGGGGGFGAAPIYNSPEYIGAGDFDPGPAFSYKDFVAPDPKSIADDPAFQWRFSQGLKALSAQKAGQGTFLSGATGKGLEDYGQNAASQEYSNIWNRSLSEYDTNRNNAFGTWASAYGQRKDAYGFKAQDAANHNNFNLTNAQNDWNSIFSQWSKQGDWLTTLANYAE